MLARARTYAAEVESQRTELCRSQRIRQDSQDRIVHGATVERMRMAEHGDVLVGWFCQLRFQGACGPVDGETFAHGCTLSGVAER